GGEYTRLALAEVGVEVESEILGDRRLKDGSRAPQQEIVGRGALLVLGIETPVGLGITADPDPEVGVAGLDHEAVGAGRNLHFFILFRRLLRWLLVLRLVRRCFLFGLLGGLLVGRPC